MIPMADHRADKHIKFCLLAQAASLANLSARFELHQLPEWFVSSIMDDARQNPLFLLTDLKASLTTKKQELDSHVDKLQQQSHEGLASLQRSHKENDANPTLEQRFAQIIPDLQALENIADSLKMCMD